MGACILSVKKLFGAEKFLITRVASKFLHMATWLNESHRQQININTQVL